MRGEDPVRGRDRRGGADTAADAAVDTAEAAADTAEEAVDTVDDAVEETVEEAAESYDGWTKAQLQEELVNRGLPKSGNVAELRERLRSAD